jgi:NAD(P)H dehydrogenase (quinone)
MAEAVHGGVGSVEGVSAALYEIAGHDIHEGRWSNPDISAALDSADAILFGTPTYMGSVSAQMKAFIDASLERWYKRAWEGKLAAGFTVSSTPSGDKLNALMTLAVNAMQHGMIWVGQDVPPINREGLNRLSVYFGSAGQAEYGKGAVAVHATDLETARRHGARVAMLARRLAAASA